MRRIRDFIVGVLVVAAICIAGSDGPYFPWLNFAAVLWMIAAAWIAKRAMKVSR